MQNILCKYILGVYNNDTVIVCQISISLFVIIPDMGVAYIDFILMKFYP